MVEIIINRTSIFLIELEIVVWIKNKSNLNQNQKYFLYKLEKHNLRSKLNGIKQWYYW
jgi:hypothetical protein